MSSELNRNVGIAATTLLASSATLVCCVLPAVMVSLGAGAALVGLVSTFPQLIWLSEHKALVFGIAGAMLAISGVVLWNARRLPCPTDPQLARSCMRLRSISNRLWAVAAIAYIVGAGFVLLTAR
jgi:uncharacterized iron-regulated membrane protein